MWKNSGQKWRYNFIFGCLIVLGIFLIIPTVLTLYPSALILIHFDEVVEPMRNSFSSFMRSDRAVWFFFIMALVTNGFGVIYFVFFIFSHNPRHWKRTCIMTGILLLDVLGSRAWDMICFPGQALPWQKVLYYVPYPLFALYQRNIYTKNS